MEAILRRYNRAVGIPDIPTRGYHDTITTASMRAAPWYLGKHAPNASLADVLADLMSGELGDPKWLLTYWSEESLMSLEARRGWVEPDLRELPF